MAMRRWINYIMLMIILTFSILFSYGKISYHVKSYTLQEICDYFRSDSISHAVEKNTD